MTLICVSLTISDQGAVSCPLLSSRIFFGDMFLKPGWVSVPGVSSQRSLDLGDRVRQTPAHCRFLKAVTCLQSLGGVFQSDVFILTERRFQLSFAAMPSAPSPGSR